MFRYAGLNENAGPPVPDAILLVEALIYRSFDYPSDSKAAIRCRLLAREIGEEYGVPVEMVE